MALKQVIAPRHRRKTISPKPAAAEAEFPIHDFIVSPSDSLGRSVSLSVIMPPLARRAASNMVAKGLFGFMTEGDVWRYCIDRGLADLADKSGDGEITGDVALMRSWNQLAQVELEHAHYATTLGIQEKLILTLIKTGHAERALALAEQLWMDHDKVENPYWRKLFRQRAKLVLDKARTAAQLPSSPPPKLRVVP